MSFPSLSNFDIDNHFKGNKRYIGTRASDRLPKSIGKRSIVINFDKYGNPGTHWVCVYGNNPKWVYYFDSFGMDPPKSIYTFLKSGGRKVLMNDLQIQHKDSNMCGYYCLDVIDRLDKGESFIDIIYDYEHNPAENEQKIRAKFTKS